MTVRERTPTHEPARVKKFRLELARAVPRFPNDRASLQNLEGKGLRDVLVDFINWRARYVGARPRTVSVGTEAILDPRWLIHLAAINAFLEKVRKGEDLTPYLSLEPHTRGFTPAALKLGASAEDKWSDKDFLLITNGFHHFHLGVDLEPGGHVKRTDDLLFAHVTREVFTIIAIFDHSVFDFDSPERDRLGAVHQRYVLRGSPPGSMIMAASVSTSGHNTDNVLHALRCTKTVFNIDPNLDSRSYMTKLYENAGQPVPDKPKFAWGFNHLDLGVCDMRSKLFFTILKGQN